MITIVIKTFIRYGVLRRCISGFQRIAPGVPIIVIDDSPQPQTLSIEGVRQIITEPDIGVSAGRNLGFQEAKTEYIFYSDDDHLARMTEQDFAAAYSIFRDNGIDLLGWKGYRFERKGATLRMKGTPCPEGQEWQYVDATQYSFFARRATLLNTPHDERVKTNGEHFDFFLNLKEAGAKVAASPYLSFKNAKTGGAEYQRYRQRSGKHFTKEKHGLKKIIW